MSSDESSGQRWLPLEANPDVLNTFVGKLGLKASWQFTDVFGFEPELLGMLPQPVCALLLLFPINEKNESFSKEQCERLSKEGQHVGKDVFFMKQTIGNACGTIGLLHAIANNTESLDIDPGYLQEFVSATTNMTADERGAYLENDRSISTYHADSAQQGQSEVPNVEDKVNLHFVALVRRGEHLYELDGRKPFPINHGPTTADSFLLDGAKVCQQFMARDPSELHFTVMALAKAF